MLKYIISSILFLITFSVLSQGKVKDTVKYKDRYGLRVGIDLFMPIYSIFDSDSKGLEIVADYRVTKRFWAAAELGYTNHLSEVDYFNFTTDGSYIKLGVDFNTYNNWPKMENMIYVGLRYGLSMFSQTLNEYSVNADPFLPEQVNETPVTYNGLNAHWIEALIGLKVEVLHNFFLGVSFSGKHIIATKEPDNFKNLYVPGFNRVYFNDFGFSFNYSISYLIPFYRK